MEDSLRELGVKPRKDQIEKEYTWLDTKLVNVPNVLGLTTTELREQMVNLKLDIAGSGDTVVQQSPAAGVKVKEGSTLRLYLGKSDKKTENE